MIPIFFHKLGNVKKYSLAVVSSGIENYTFLHQSVAEVGMFYSQEEQKLELSLTEMQILPTRTT